MERQTSSKSMPHSARALCIAAFVCLVVALPAFAQDREQKPENCCLWRVESGKATLYVLGSVHVGNEKMYPLNPAIEAAFEASDVLVVEINISKVNHAKLNRLVLRKGMYSGDDTLEKNLSKETLKRLKPFLKKQGLSLAAVNKQRPWMVSLMLSMQEIVKLGYKPELGLDKHFLNKATAREVEILELETAEGQIEALASVSKELQELLLLSTIEEYSDAREMMEEMLEAWNVGDAKRLDELIRETVLENPELRPVMKALFDDRNAKMFEKIEKYLKTDKTYFVVVGAGHVVGRKGIIQLLRDKGLTVKQIRKRQAAVGAGAL